MEFLRCVFACCFGFIVQYHCSRRQFFPGKNKKSDEPSVSYPQQQADSDKMKSKEKRLGVESHIFLSGVDEDHNRTKCVSGQMFADMLAETL